METKKFTADTVNEALKSIKLEFGNDALIISTKRVRQKNGALGLFGKEVFEVTASKGDDNYKSPYANKSYLSGFNDNSSSLSEVKDILSEIQGQVSNNESAGQLQHLRQEITELKGVIKLLQNQKPSHYDKDWHENIVALYQKLIVNGLDERFSLKLIDEINKKVAPINYDDYDYLKLFSAKTLMMALQVKNLLAEKSGIVALIGTTGVGKTTSLAKIVSQIKLQNKNKKIALITLDNYRIGAVEQLKEYAKIIKAPIKALESVKDLPGAINQFKDCDWIFIDTPGHSQRDATRLKNLANCLNSIKNCTKLLTLSASTKDFELGEITNRFSDFKIDGTIFTKLDEASSYGSLLNHMIKYKLPLYFLSTGQGVPDDIELASFERIVDLVLNMSESAKKEG